MNKDGDRGFETHGLKKAIFDLHKKRKATLHPRQKSRIEAIAVPRRIESNVVPSTLYCLSIGLETKKKEKNDFKRLHNKRKARNESRD